MRWNLRMKAAKRGIWKSTELRRLFADAGLQVSAGKMSALWTGTELIRAALDSPDAAVALAVALVAFHALTSKQIGDLRLADIIDGRLTLGGRVIPLATPVRVRLAARPPRAHLARQHQPLPVHQPQDRPTPDAGRPVLPWVRSGISSRALREDRILNEIHATGGDVRRICDLFGLTIDAALRYATTFDTVGDHQPAGAASRNGDNTARCQ